MTIHAVTISVYPEVHSILVPDIWPAPSLCFRSFVITFFTITIICSIIGLFATSANEITELSVGTNSQAWACILVNTVILVFNTYIHARIFCDSKGKQFELLQGCITISVVISAMMFVWTFLEVMRVWSVPWLHYGIICIHLSMILHLLVQFWFIWLCKFAT